MTNIHYQAAFFGDPAKIAKVYGKGRRQRLEQLAEFYPRIVSAECIAHRIKELSSIRYIFSTWGMMPLSPDDLSRLPALEAVFYAAGSVRLFAEPLLKHGVKVISAWQANARPVSDFTVSLIMLACKGFFPAAGKCSSPLGWSLPHPYPGAFDTNISILGAGAIGRRVIASLRSSGLGILVFDPFLRDSEAARLGGGKVSLAEAFQKGFVVSNHLANLPETRGLIRGDLFRTLPRRATFINTGRGATVEESEMLSVLQGRQDITAILDVTDPEPPPAGSLLFSLENVILTPHIAGSIGNEVLRLADLVIQEFERYRQGMKLKYEITLQKLKTMA